jgi:hypothetical protein
MAVHGVADACSDRALRLPIESGQGGTDDLKLGNVEHPGGSRGVQEAPYRAFGRLGSHPREVLCFMCAHNNMTHASRLLPSGSSRPSRREPTPKLWPDRRRAGHQRSGSACRRPCRLAAPPMTVTAASAERAATPAREVGQPRVVGVKHRDQLARSASEPAEHLSASSVGVAGSSAAGSSSWPRHSWRGAVRTPVAYRGQRNMPGPWWLATRSGSTATRSALGASSSAALQRPSHPSGSRGRDDG